MIRIGVLTPHEVPGPEAEFAMMAPGRLTVRVARITGTTDPGGSGGPVSPAELGPLTTAPLLDRAAEQLVTEPADVIGYASTTAAYATGFDAEMAMVVRLCQLTGRPVAATCASAVRGLRVLQVERIALIGAPWCLRVLPIYRLMVRPHPGSSGLGRASRFTSRGATSGCALTILVCSVGSSAAAFSRSGPALLRKRPIALRKRPMA